MDLVACLLRQAEAVHADETPAHAAGGLRYVHLACTAFLTHMHTGDRSADAVDAGGVLRGYAGIVVRDGYHGGYGHLTDALHAWCGAHLLRDLRDLYQFEPGVQDWAQQMAGLLIEARDAARTARAEARKALDAGIVAGLTSRYRSIAESGLAVNVYRRTATASDARRIARRFLKHEDMILRFITRPDLDIFTNNQAERTIRPVKVQQRSSGAAGAPSAASPTSPSFSPTCPPPRNGASPRSTRSAASSTDTPGCHPDSSQPDKTRLSTAPQQAADAW
jgi:transposase